MTRASVVLLLCTSFASSGCIPLIAAGVARNRRADADQAEENALCCWQGYRRRVEAGYDNDTTATMRETCEELDLEARRAGRRADASAAAARDSANQAAANRSINCTSNRIGNSVYTNCD